MMTQSKLYELIRVGLWVVLMLLGRLLPHWPNMTPMIAICLVATRIFPKRMVMLLVLVVMMLTDAMIAWIHHYAIFGSWTVFTYTGWLAIIFFGSKLLPEKIMRLLTAAVSATFIFWLWTNFGTWLLSGLYSMTWQGLIRCYIAALPFLRNGLVGSVFWMFVLWYFMLRSASVVSLFSRRGISVKS